MNCASYLCRFGGMSKSFHHKNKVCHKMSAMLMCPFTSNELIGPFLDTYGGLILVYLVYYFAQFHDSV